MMTTTTSSLQQVNGNHLELIITFTNWKRLRPDQITAVKTYVGDPLPVQLSKIYVLGLANENALTKFQGCEAYIQDQLGSEDKHRTGREHDALFRQHIAGKTGKNNVQALLLRFRWGNFVAGTEHDQAVMDIIQKSIADAFTQSCSIIKKEIVKSVENPRPKKSDKHVPSLCPKAECTMIYQLTKTIVQKLSSGKAISIPITPALCAHIAMMCKWHVRIVDGMNITKRITKAFSSILDKDREHHRSNPDEKIPNATTTTDDAAITYQADINVALDARNQGQHLSPLAEHKKQQSRSGASAGAPKYPQQWSIWHSDVAGQASSPRPARPSPGPSRPGRARHRASAGSGLGLDQVEAQAGPPSSGFMVDLHFSCSMAIQITQHAFSAGFKVHTALFNPCTQEAACGADSKINEAQIFRIPRAIDKALQKVNEYYQKASNSYMFAMVLDPREKFSYFEKHWPEVLQTEVIKNMEETAQAQGPRPEALLKGLGLGLGNLKPKPAQARPKPGASGQAGPATSLIWQIVHKFDTHTHHLSSHPTFACK
ncbi:hypothetical protein DFH08DRAFT_817951 [Mycena albidolilacea]|uniref:Uncharacterized protein n=1 Tax=Mycena albidolilacea TaxID=1033008 RepID=A0AAD6ZI42_9AGAR|nr:hypothetical protein DFH08DRAFT_817951 [Mycena albidolilacea]